MTRTLATLIVLVAAAPAQEPSVPLELLVPGVGAGSFGGIRPHLASFNDQNECGTGAVVPWAGRLWWLTYAPHRPDGSDDRLYAMNAAGDLLAWPGSIGGTPANRMIHAESRQLFIGPYAIDADGGIRVVPYSRMRGRPTGNARHLTDPARRIYAATMEEGIYALDVGTLAVETLFTDTHDRKRDSETGLPGYHGKGLYSGQGVLVYANNGEHGKEAQARPDIPSGVLAEWDGEGRGPGRWRVVRRAQFTDVTGPGGLRGNARPATDPLWSIGWDHRSLLLMLRSTREEERGIWHTFRLPKASHCYDGAHGWNTEWPRIRDIGEDDLLMTMHGTFWRFPRSFDVGATAGIAPRSTYLKVIGDFCRYGDQVVFGCDDAARSEFLNRRRAKGKLAGPAQSQSNLWFVDPGRIDRCGPVLGHAGLFVDDAVAAGQWSDPMLFSGYAHRGAHLVHDAAQPVTFRFEVDAGDGRWRALREVTVPPGEYRFEVFGGDDPGAWIRVAPDRAATLTVWFEMRGVDDRGVTPADTLASLAVAGPDLVARGGLLRAGTRERGLQVLAHAIDGTTSAAAGYYELGPDLRLVRVESPTDAAWMKKNVAIPRGVVRRQGDAMLFVDDDGRRWLLPVGNPAFLATPALLDLQRTAREVVTERDLFQCAGTFFELPARNAGGFAKIRPVASHRHFVHDFASWRGMLVLTGLRPGALDDERVIVSEDRACAVWLGTVDDLWRLGRPRGRGGPWRDTPVRAGVPSDPFLMNGYDRKSVMLEHDADAALRFHVELDVTGTGSWHRWRTFEVPAGAPVTHAFPPELAAYWVRVVADGDCRATACFVYE